MEDIARAVASWPVVALAIALFFCFLFRQQIAERLGATTKMSVAGLKVKFAQSIKISFQNFDIRRQIPSPGPGSLVDEVLGMIVSTAPTSCILINLGEGKEWLTSRLFILAVLLQKFRDVKVLAFTDGDVQEGHFVGWAETEKVSAALGNFYRHLAYAYNAVLKKSDAEPKRKRHSFEEMPGSPEYLLYYYLQEIRSSEAPSEPESGDWVYMEGEGAGWRVAREAAYERARWVTPTLLHRMLGSYLVTSKIQVNERDKDASVRAVLLQKESFVAAVTQDGKFEGLVERLDLVDQAIRVMLGKA